MGAPNVDGDNVTSIGSFHHEKAYFEFAPSDQLRERIIGLVQPGYREHMGRRALFLYSNFGQEVTFGPRRALTYESHQTVTEMQKIIDVHGAGQRKLAKFVRADLLPNDVRPQDSQVRLQLGVALDFKTVAALQASTRISSQYIASRSIPVNLQFPANQLLPSHRRQEAIGQLHELIFDSDDERINLMSPSTKLGAFVTNMRVVLRNNGGR